MLIMTTTNTKMIPAWILDKGYGYWMAASFFMCDFSVLTLKSVFFCCFFSDLRLGLSNILSVAFLFCIQKENDY